MYVKKKLKTYEFGMCHLDVEGSVYKSIMKVHGEKKKESTWEIKPEKKKNNRKCVCTCWGYSLRGIAC